jgi:hypothetical protein
MYKIGDTKMVIETFTAGLVWKWGIPSQTLQLSWEDDDEPLDLGEYGFRQSHILFGFPGNPQSK